MNGRLDPYACCTEGRLRPAWSGMTPVLGCTACGETIEPDPNHPDAGTGAWYEAALAMCPPGTGDPEEDRAESDLYDVDAPPLPDGPDPNWPWLPAGH
jgi:hypothetical protein